MKPNSEHAGGQTGDLNIQIIFIDFELNNSNNRLNI